MTWWHYLLLVNFYLVLFFGFYALLLRRETFFQLNRIYLVAASLFSFFIPLIQSDWVKDLFITKEVQYTLYGSPIVLNYSLQAAESTLTMGQILCGIYIAVAVFLLFRLLWQLVVLKKAIEKPSSAAYSFFKKISLGESHPGSKIIAEHEQVHARQWHSVDVLIIEMVMVVNWFNPVVYLYRFAIQYIHEFIADREVVQLGTDKADYALLLLSQTFEVPTHRLLTPFYNHSLLKKRIMMLQKNRSHRIVLAKYGLSAPLFILMLIFSSATVNNSKAVDTINKKAEKIFLTPAADAVDGIVDHAQLTDADLPKENIENIVTDTDKVFAVVEQQPQFHGGYTAFAKYIGRAIKYPAADRKNKIEGLVIVQFIVEKDGSLNKVKAVRGPSLTLNREAERVIAASPNWIPGYQNGKKVRVSYTIPVRFNLNAANNKVVWESPPNVNKDTSHYAVFDYSKNGEHPVYILDGQRIDAAKATTLDEKSIKSVAAFKGNSAKIYGPEAEKYGAVVLTSKVKITDVTLTPPENRNIVFTQVDVQPSFPGGMDEFYRFLSGNLQYPATMREKKIEGRVIVQFIVEKDGALTNLNVVRGLGYGSAEEVVRVLSLSPKWKPGIQNGNPVRVSYTVPISFMLSGVSPVGKTNLSGKNNNGIELRSGDLALNITDRIAINKPDEQPMIILDGERIDMNKFKALDQSTFKTVVVLRDKSAKFYGPEAEKNGAIVITDKAKVIDVILAPPAGSEQKYFFKQ